MKKIKVKAIFRGLNNSCGYKTNSEYVLIVHHKKGENVQIETINNGGFCEYSSMLSFFENWDNVRRF